jgi:transcriptional regulator with XRE-family HTH domain
MSTTAKGLSMRIKRLREHLSLTQEQLAKKAGVSHGYLARLEIGMHDPSLGTLLKLAKALEVTVAELLSKGRT